VRALTHVGILKDMRISYCLIHQTNNNTVYTKIWKGKTQEFEASKIIPLGNQLDENRQRLIQNQLFL
jgi:hypothetical protein